MSTGNPYVDRPPDADGSIRLGTPCGACGQLAGIPEEVATRWQSVADADWPGAAAANTLHVPG
ncbi:MAG TPA: hypothetical protein VFI46_01450 [Jiangellaceae bacterium]|nr:hypothetical protein [Jiangellaceae bacterium]